MYIFKHALVRDAAYQSLLKHERQRLHLIIGEMLERRHRDRLEEHAPVLAQHFDEGGDDVRALKYYLLAGHAAARRYAHPEAIAHYTRGLKIAARGHATREQYEHLFMRRGDAFELNAQYDDALRNYDEMESMADAHNDPALKLAALMAHARLYATYTLMHDPDRAQAQADRALRLAHKSNDRAAEAKVLWIMLLIHQALQQPQRAIEYGEQSVALARELNVRQQQAFTLNDLGRMYMAIGQVERGHAALREARALWREFDNLPMLADNLNSTASVYLHSGEYDQALTLADEAQHVSETIGNLWGQSSSLEIAGYIHLERGDLAQGFHTMEEAIRIGTQAGFLDAMVSAPVMLGWVCGMIGAFDRGLAAAQRALLNARERLPLAVLALQTLMAWLCLLKGDHAQAEAISRDIDHVPTRELENDLTLRVAQGILAFARHDFARAETEMSAVVDLLDQIEARFLRAEALYLKGAALLALQRLDEAHSVLSDARTVADALNVRLASWQILIALSQIEAQRGHADEARALRRQARTVITYVADHSPPDLRTAFLDLPDVRRVMSDE